MREERWASMAIPVLQPHDLIASRERVCGSLGRMPMLRFALQADSRSLPVDSRMQVG